MTQFGERYRRQLELPGFGQEGQEKLAASSVLVAGLGGLGGPVALYLAAAGVGRLVICDSDVVEASNLNRQILYRTSDLGKSKAVMAGRTLQALNPEIRVESHVIRLDRSNISGVAKEVEIVADCLDNIHGRLELNHWCIENNIPLVHGGIEAWGGQLTFIHPPATPCLACLFREEENKTRVPVMGSVAGILGSMQALVVINHLTGSEKTLRNRILLLDGQNMEWSGASIGRLEDCPACSNLKRQ